MRPRVGRFAVALSLLVAGLGACSSDADTGPAARTSSTVATTTTAAAATTAAPTPAAPPKLALREVARLDQPLMLAPVPGATDAFFVIEKPGRLRRLDAGRPGPVLVDLTAEVSTGGERGLLGLAIHPDGRHLYLDFTDTDGDTHVVEYALTAAGTVDPGSRRELLEVDQPYPNHNGGHLEFGPDGMLYVALGDGGGAGDPQNRAQDLGELLGKILRIDVDAPRSRPYGIPPDNPFGDEIWAYGLRNPWRFSFDRATGTLWIGDVGQDRFEEIDRAPASSKGGENYGWNRLEGRSRFKGDPPEHHVLPLVAYDRQDGSCSVTGGRVYRGTRSPALAGWYVFGDYCRGELLGVAADADAPAEPVELGAKVTSLVSFAEDAAGELYALSLDGGVYRLEIAGP